MSNNSKTVWLTGIPSSGKTTIAELLSKQLRSKGVQTLILDGDKLRSGLSTDLDFSAASRRENIRRAAQIARIGNEQGIFCIAALVSPFWADREMACEIIGRERFLEVYLEADPSQCEIRDPKGNYKRARSGSLRSFTGIDASYEPPASPWLKLNTTSSESAEQCVRRLFDEVVRR